MNKKGITPVISSILLIAFAVGLGAIVMSWGAGVSFEESPENACEQTIMEVVTVGENPEACYTDNEIMLTLFNKGQYMIDGLKIAAIGETDVQDIIVETTIEQASARKVMSEYEALRVGTLRKIIITPVVSIDHICPAQSISLDALQVC